MKLSDGTELMETGTARCNSERALQIPLQFATKLFLPFFFCALERREKPQIFFKILNLLLENLSSRICPCFKILHLSVPLP
jgi:hypothetical protein